MEFAAQLSILVIHFGMQDDRNILRDPVVDILIL